MQSHPYQHMTHRYPVEGSWFRVAVWRVSYRFPSSPLGLNPIQKIILFSGLLSIFCSRKGKGVKIFSTGMEHKGREESDLGRGQFPRAPRLHQLKGRNALLCKPRMMRQKTDMSL